MKRYYIPYSSLDAVENPDGDWVEYSDYYKVYKIATDLLESIRTGVQLSFKELDRMEGILNDG